MAQPERDPARPPGEKAELALLERVVAGDDEAFTQLYKLYQPRVQLFLRRMLGDALVAEEVADDVMVVVWRDARRFRRQSKLSTWIFGIAYRRACKALRRQRASFVPLETDMPGGIDSAQGFETEQWFDAAFRQLSPEQRLVMELTFVNGCSYQEIAEIAGCPVNTVKTRMFHARRRLKALLATLSRPIRDRS